MLEAGDALLEHHPIKLGPAGPEFLWHFRHHIIDARRLDPFECPYHRGNGRLNRIGILPDEIPPRIHNARNGFAAIDLDSALEIATIGYHDDILGILKFSYRWIGDSDGVKILACTHCRDSTGTLTHPDERYLVRLHAMLGEQKCDKELARSARRGNAYLPSLQVCWRFVVLGALTNDAEHVAIKAAEFNDGFDVFPRPCNCMTCSNEPAVISAPPLTTACRAFVPEPVLIMLTFRPASSK